MSNLFDKFKRQQEQNRIDRAFGLLRHVGDKKERQRRARLTIKPRHVARSRSL